VILSILLGGGALFGLIYFGLGYEVKSATDQRILMAICLFFVLLPLYLSAELFSIKVILFEDALEFHELRRKVRILRADIVGYRIIPTRYVATLVLTAKSRKPLKLPLFIKTDDDFFSWLEDSTNLDAQDLINSEAELKSDPQLGFTEQERIDRIQQGRKTAKWLNRIAGAVFFWGWFFPLPYDLVITIAAALPVYAIFVAARSPGLFDFEGRRNDARADIAIALVCPAIILGGRTFFDFDFVNATPIFLWGLAVGTVLTLAVLRTSGAKVRMRKSTLIFMGLFLVVYGCGLAGEVDVRLNRSTAEVLPANVLDKRVSNGKTTTWYLRLSPWPGRPRINDISVPEAMYNTVHSGQQVCLYVYGGALRIPYFWAVQCPQ
jgi:hypothetical protein